MSGYIERCCFRCHKQIGQAEYHYYFDDVNQIIMYLHYPTCWNEVKDAVVEEYIWLIYRAKYKEVS